MDNKLFSELWSLQDDAYDLMMEYDSIPHTYGEEVMYHTEGQIIDIIAEYPGITCTEISRITGKTPSACSQLARKLRDKQCVEQIRNEENNRIYNLRLTDKGQQIYNDRRLFNLECQEQMKKLLEVFTDEELSNHIEVQKKINEAYRGDIERSRIQQKQ